MSPPFDRAGAPEPVDSPARPLAILHLSDIHFGQESGDEVHINEDVRNEVVHKVREIAKDRRSTGRPPINYIVVTGDIAFSGQADQYSQAEAWLNQLAESAGCELTNVLVVPGNHDVDDGGSSKAMSHLVEQIHTGGAEELDRVLKTDTDRDVLGQRFKHYRVFAERFGCKLGQDLGRDESTDREHVFAPGSVLRIAGLNSALICRRGDRKGTLLLGARQWVFSRKEGTEWLVLVHHPLNWMRDGKEATYQTRNRVRILMCGHEHQPRVRSMPAPDDSRLLIVDAGATVPKRPEGRYNYTFNIVDITLADTRRDIDVVVQGYAWMKSRQRFVKTKSLFSERLPCPSYRTPLAEGAKRSPEPRADAHLPTNAAGAALNPPPLDAPKITAGDAPPNYARARVQFLRHVSPKDQKDILAQFGRTFARSQIPTAWLTAAFDDICAEGRLAELERAIARALSEGRRDDA